MILMLNNNSMGHACLFFLKIHKRKNISKKIDISFFSIFISIFSFSRRSKFQFQKSGGGGKSVRDGGGKRGGLGGRGRRE